MIYSYKNAENITNLICRDTVCSPNPKELGYEPKEPNTINL